MKNLWNPVDASKHQSDLEQRVYSSQLLGRDPTLVLHGGGNTSVKVTEQNLFGEPEEILYVKGSGWDLETIQAEGFVPVRMEHLLRLAQLDVLPDIQMVNELATHVTRKGAPAPSVETILHAVLPYKFVDHTHADAIVAITNTDDGERRIREIYGDDVVVIPYVMPGFDLARVCAQKFEAEAKPSTVGMVLLKHGIFSFGATAEESYRRMIELVDRAEDYLRKKKAWDVDVTQPTAGRAGKATREEIATLRRDLSLCAGFPMIMSTHSDSKSLGFAAANNVKDLSQRGPATPGSHSPHKTASDARSECLGVCRGLSRLFCA